MCSTKMSYVNQTENKFKRKEKEEMKNTFLKKACAVALAAVMAVTFAPVASLNVFASNNGVDGTGTIGKEATASIDEAGTYEVRTSGTVEITLPLNAMDGTYTFDVTKASTKATFKFTGAAAKNVTVNIKGETTTMKTAKGVTVEIPTVDFKQDAKQNWDKVSVNLSGNMILGDMDEIKGAPLVKGLRDNAVATINGGKELYLGNATIDGIQHIITDPVDIVAYNGNVEVTGLKSGSTATVNSWVYNYGTSIKATAADKVALAKVSTTLNYDYVVYDNNGNTSVTIPGTYVEDAYYAGYSKINKGVYDTAVPCTAVTTRTESTVKVDIDGTQKTGYVYYVSVNDATKLLDDASAERLKNYTDYYWKNIGLVWTYDKDAKAWVWKVNDVFYNATGWKATYTQAITINQNGEDWTGKYLDAYLNNFSKDGDRVKGITYYTADPSSFTKSEDGVAAIDGAKYVVSDHKQAASELTYAANGFASKSVAILRGTEVKATAGNDYAYETFEKTKDLDVTAPADMSIVKATSDNVTGRYQWTENEWRAYGVNRSGVRNGDTAVYVFPYKKKDETATNKNIDVAQVASGATMTVYVDPRVKITKADKLGYFETDVLDTTDAGALKAAGNIVGADWQKVTFGEAAPATKEFVSTVKAQKSEAEFYASKEIKTKVEGVDPDVKITGEINADIVDTVNGKNTWDVNTNAAKAASQVTAHRMYSGREHVYTADPNEIAMLVAAGWKDEGPAFTVNAVASGKGTPIYRLYNKNNGGMHFYTASAAEKDMLLANGWTEGKPVFYGADKATGIPVYRTYNTGSNNGEHNYTTNMAEVEMNVQKGWRAEGVAFYVFK